MVDDARRAGVELAVAVRRRTDLAAGQGRGSADFAATYRASRAVR